MRTNAKSRKPVRESAKTSCFTGSLSHNERVSRCFHALWLLLVIIAGCATKPSAPPDVDLMPPPEATTNAPVVTNTPAPIPQPVAPMVTTPPPTTNHFNLNETWIPLDRWCQSNGFGPVRRIETDNSPAFSFVSTNGTMTIKIGSQLATWRGAQFTLGFPPQMMSGHPFVRSLDIRKNLMPLLENPGHAKTNHLIVIDPGHGGTDTGTRNVFNGHSEKEFTLDWARRLQAILETNGWTVWLTRTNDARLQLTDRVTFSSQHPADLFLSLHFNSAYPDDEESGLETYCLTPHGMPSNLTRGFEDNALLTFPNNSFDEKNIQYAVQLHRSLLKVNGHLDRGVRRARFLSVLREQNRPAVLIEGGYLSNMREAKRIADPAYRQKLAEAVAQALLEESGGGLTNHPPVLVPTNNLATPIQ
jgi:N-acetylmuramoyl-L-alanine amidase